MKAGAVLDVFIMITDASPELGEDGQVKVTPKQQEQVLNLAQDVCQAVVKIPTPKHIGTALHILKETRGKSTLSLTVSRTKIYYNNGNGS